MLEHLKGLNQKKNSENNKENDENKILNTFSSYCSLKKSENQIYLKYFNLANEIFEFDVKNTKNAYEKNKFNFEDVLKSIFEILKDDSIFYLLENINLLTYEESNLIYKILKKIIVLGKYKNDVPNEKNKKYSNTINSFVQNHLKQIVNCLQYNLLPSNKDYVIIVISKLFRKLFQLDDLLPKILTIEFFNEIYSHTKSERFVLSQESFKILFYIVEGKKINKDITSVFLEKNCDIIFNIINTGINYTGYTKQNNSKECLLDDFYFMKRQTLVLIEKILLIQNYENFANRFVNNSDNLKTIMRQLNNKCEKIVCQAVDILYFFFLDIEIKEKNIKKILHFNKDNFYEFFEKNEELFSQSSELAEKKSFILYELERLENYLD
jgi:hypothetical protein